MIVDFRSATSSFPCQRGRPCMFGSEGGIFVDRTPIDREEASRYLYDCFLSDLRMWFTIEPYRACPECYIVLFMDDQHNPNRPYNHLINNDPRRSHIFAAAFRAMIELTQAVIREQGEAAAAEYCKSRGWPLCSAGLGGMLLPPEQMAKEANLFPDSRSYVPFYDKAVTLFRELMSARQ